MWCHPSFWKTRRSSSPRLSLAPCFQPKRPPDEREDAAAACAYVAPWNPLRAWPTVTARLQSRSCSQRKKQKKLKTTLECKSLSERVCSKTFKCAPRGTSLRNFSVVWNHFLQFVIRVCTTACGGSRLFWNGNSSAKFFMETSLPVNSYTPSWLVTLSSDVTTQCIASLIRLKSHDEHKATRLIDFKSQSDLLVQSCCHLSASRPFALSKMERICTFIVHLCARW